MATATEILFGAQNGKIGIIDIDCRLTEEHEYEVDVTQYPVESGIAISDNVRRKPIKFSLSGIVSNSPVKILGDLTTAGLLESRAKTALSYERLKQIYFESEPVDVRTTLETYIGYIMTKISFPRSLSTGEGLFFNATFQEFRTVESEFSIVDRAKNVSGKDTNIEKRVSSNKSGGSVSDKKTVSFLRIVDKKVDSKASGFLGGLL